ncbi:MAG: hypothetical protein KGR26_06235, partial [Cyanobacteria bacterium REEB65]|nr:hypothetical protein [Cyanobacteria bacterium REEB65]
MPTSPAPQAAPSLAPQTAPGRPAGGGATRTPTGPLAARQDSPARNATKKMRLGEWLSTLGLISQFQLSDALTVQVETGRKLGEILITKGYISEKELADVLALQETLADKNSIIEFEVDKTLLALVPQPFARQNNVVPLVKVGRRLVVGMLRVDDVKTLDTLSLLTGYLVVPLPIRDDDLQQALATFYENKVSAKEAAIEKAVKVAGDDKPATTRRIEDISESATDSDAPVIELVNSILNDAIEKGASDIHLEPRDGLLEVRFRLDG